MVGPSASTFVDFADKIRPAIEQALVARTEFDDDTPPILREAIRHSLLAPGKRLRPLLVLMACEACGSPHEQAMPAACAVEMIHTYSLIHDDLPAMDDDDLRRGLPTCHAKYGEAIAILAGDALLTRSFEVLANEVTPSATAVRCVADLAQAAGASALVGGQVDDLSAEFSSGGLPELEAIHRRKTGALFRVSLRLGGLIAGATNEQLDRLDSYGRHLGVAFQIVDDLLDVSGNEATVGKRIGKDSSRGKLTFPGIMGTENSRQQATELIEKARAALTPFETRAENLDQLAVYVLQRNH